MKSQISLYGLVLSSLLSLPVFASPLNDYNLILTGDYNYQGGDVEGATFIGGNLKGGGNSPTFATRTFANPVGLTVVGDIYGQNINMNNGKNVEYGGTNRVSNRINLNGGGKVTQNTQLSAAAIEDQLLKESSYYGALVANGSFSNGRLTYTGSDEVAVFDLAASVLFAQNTNLQLNYGTAKTVIINVSGADIAVAGGVNLNSGSFSNLGAANILWNFEEATKINFNGLGMYGAVLAINANTSGGSSFKGSFAAKSYTGARAFQQFGFNPNIPAPAEDPASIPEPSMALIFITGLLGMAALHRRKNRSRIQVREQHA